MVSKWCQIRKAWCLRRKINGYVLKGMIGKKYGGFLLTSKIEPSHKDTMSIDIYISLKHSLCKKIV